MCDGLFFFFLVKHIDSLTVRHAQGLGHLYFCTLLGKFSPVFHCDYKLVLSLFKVCAETVKCDEQQSKKLVSRINIKHKVGDKVQLAN